MDWFSKMRLAIQDYGLEYFKRYYAIYRGTVADNEDPEVLGRIRINVPATYGKRTPDYWAWPKGMYAGKDIGFYALPNKGDMIWVSFENGDPKYPVWEYGHWAMGQVPNTVKGPKQKLFQTTSGMRLLFDDDKKKIVVYKSDGRVIELNEKGISLGSEGKSGHPGVLGDILEEILEELRGEFSTSLGDLIKYATTQNTAVASVAVLSPLAPGYAELLTKLTELKVQVDKLQKKIPNIKSKIITLD